jgi:4'-phosphopantetheinyl transferase
MIRVVYYKMNFQENKYLNLFINEMPPLIKNKIAKYHAIEDKIRGLIGKVILRNLLVEYGYSKDILNQLKIDKFSRPYIDDEVDFNISHSGNYVVCALSNKTKVGVDIEEIKNICIKDFYSVLTKHEVNEIESNNNSLPLFFSFWTMKEALIKANGKGFAINLKDIHFKTNVVHLENEEWKIFNLNLDDNYSSYIAYQGDLKINIKELKITNLFGFKG